MATVKVGRCLLDEILHKKGLSQQQGADLAHMRLSQYSDYYHNRKQMSLKTAKQIALALNVHIDDLYEFKIIK